MWPGIPKVLKIKCGVFTMYQEKSSYEVGVLHADKHESLLQADIVILDGFDQDPVKFAISL